MNTQMKERLLQLGAQAGIAKEVMRDLIDSCQMAASGAHDPEAMRQACARMDRMREENRHRFGIQDIGVGIIRESRNRQ